MTALQITGLGTAVTWGVAYTAGAIFVAVYLNSSRASTAPQLAVADEHLALPPARDDLTAPEPTPAEQPQPTAPRRIGRHTRSYLDAINTPTEPLRSDEVRAAAQQRIPTTPPPQLVRPYLLGLDADADCTAEREPAADWARTGGAK